MATKGEIKQGDFFSTRQLITIPDAKGNIATIHLSPKSPSILAVALGALAIGQPPPSKHDFMGLFGNIGLVGTDDIQACLGDLQLKKLINYCTEKYGK